MTWASVADVPTALYRLMDTDEAMEDASVPIYTTIIMLEVNLKLEVG